MYTLICAENNNYKEILNYAKLSLRCKHFRGAKSEERGFWSFARMKNGVRAKIKRWGRGRNETLAAKPLDFENRPLCLSCLTDFMLSSSILVTFVTLIHIWILRKHFGRRCHRKNLMDPG